MTKKEKLLLIEQLRKEKELIFGKWNLSIHISNCMCKIEILAVLIVSNANSDFCSDICSEILIMLDDYFGLYNDLTADTCIRHIKKKRNANGGIDIPECIDCILDGLEELVSIS